MALNGLKIVASLHVHYLAGSVFFFRITSTQSRVPDWHTFILGGDPVTVTTNMMKICRYDRQSGGYSDLHQQLAALGPFALGRHFLHRLR